MPDEGPASTPCCSPALQDMDTGPSPGRTWRGKRVTPDDSVISQRRLIPTAAETDSRSPSWPGLTRLDPAIAHPHQITNDAIRVQQPSDEDDRVNPRVKPEDGHDGVGSLRAVRQQHAVTLADVVATRIGGGRVAAYAVWLPRRLAALRIVECVPPTGLHACCEGSGGRLLPPLVTATGACRSA